MANRPIQVLADDSKLNSVLVATSTTGTAGTIPVTGSDGTIGADFLATVAIADGGTGATTAIGALDNLTANGANVASAATIDLDAATGDVVDVTGTTDISTITLAAGNERRCRFTGTPKLVHSASLLLPGLGDIQTIAGDSALFRGFTGGVVQCVQYHHIGVPPAERFIVLSATNTLTNGTDPQPIFDSVGAGTLTLPLGTYFFEALLLITSMDAAGASNALIDWLGTGTAVTGSWLWTGIGADGAAATVVAQNGACMTTSASPAAAVTGVTDGNMFYRAGGTFRVTTAGTIIPSIDLAVGAAAVVAIGSYFRCRRVGNQTVQTGGVWS